MFNVCRCCVYVLRIIDPDRLKRKGDWHTFVCCLNTYEKKEPSKNQKQNESSRQTDIGKRLGTEDHFFCLNQFRIFSAWNMKGLNETGTTTHSSVTISSVPHYTCPHSANFSWEVNSAILSWSLVVIASIASLLAVITNVLVIIVIKRTKHLQSRSNFLLANLAVADILMGAFFFSFNCYCWTFNAPPSVVWVYLHSRFSSYTLDNFLDIFVFMSLNFHRLGEIRRCEKVEELQGYRDERPCKNACNNRLASYNGLL